MLALAEIPAYIFDKEFEMLIIIQLELMLEMNFSKGLVMIWLMNSKFQ